MIGEEKITSRENRRLKDARKVRDGRSDDLIFVEGLRLADEALRSGLKVNECFVTSGFSETDRGNYLLEKIGQIGTPIFELSENLFESIADTKNSQGVILICHRPSSENPEPALGKLPIIVCLDQVNNPSNLGAVCRTVEAADASGLVLTQGSADIFSPRSLRAAMGSAFRLRIGQGERFANVIDWAKEKNLIVTAAATSGSIVYTDVDWKRPRLLLFGSEAHGLSEEKLNVVKEVIRIPMQENVESLNLAVACGVVLFEARRQNQSLSR
jgi:TrmH family RNA methyltransferase